jgi:signal transduction histidine kinase
VLGRVRAARWIREAGLVVACLAFSIALDLAHSPGVVESRAWTGVDLGAGVAAALMLLARRRAVRLVAVAVAVLGFVATTTAPSAAVLQFYLGSHRRARTAVLFAVLNTLATVVSYYLRMGEVTVVSLVRTALVAAAIWGTLAALGAATRIRTALLTSLQEQAATAQLRAQEAERARIAREIHDVVAQQIALVAMQAGSLGHRRRVSSQELHDHLQSIADRARTALDDLHTVLRVLRAHADDQPPPGQDVSHDGMAAPEDGPPQPDLTELPGLIDHAREAGVAVEAYLAVPDPEQVASTPARTVYRIAQEALTNAAKHAPGAPVIMCLDEITAPAGALLRLTVHNTVYISGHGRHATTPAPGSGTGLIGVRERVELTGGTVHACGVDQDAVPPTFRLEVSLPCPR